eukprot:3186040-Rhodomonas_salina.4
MDFIGKALGPAPWGGALAGWSAAYTSNFSEQNCYHAKRAQPMPVRPTPSPGAAGPQRPSARRTMWQGGPDSGSLESKVREWYLGSRWIE